VIINRYILRQVLGTTIVVTGFLAFIMIGGQLIRYFGQAAQGRFDVSALLLLVVYRMPDFLTLILPLGFFTALMLVLGRLYVDHEMTVLNASGVSRDNLGIMLWPLVVTMVILEGVMTLYAKPLGFEHFTKLLAEQTAKASIDRVTPGKFMSSGTYTFYAGGQSADKTALTDVFIHQSLSTGQDVIIIARKALRLVDPNHLNTIIELHDGRRYELFAGKPKYSEAKFETYQFNVNDAQAAQVTSTPNDSISTLELMQHTQDHQVMSELGWRLTMPVMLLLAVILALPLAQVNPRQGRYIRLLPSILVYVALVIGVMAMKLKVAKGLSAGWYGGLMLLYLVFAMLLATRQRILTRLHGRRQVLGGTA